MNLFHQSAPLMIVFALAGYCCWSEGGGAAVGPAGKDKDAKAMLSQAMLSPTAGPTPSRNPFSNQPRLKKVALAPVKAAPVKEAVKTGSLAKRLSHLVLRDLPARRTASRHDQRPFLLRRRNVVLKDEVKHEKKADDSFFPYSWPFRQPEKAASACLVEKVIRERGRSALRR